MPSHETSRAEYEALRATIRERGTARVCSILIGFIAWGALLIGLVASDRTGAVVMIPLLVLVATFEVNFFIHTGVERVGRYLQVFYEEQSGSIGWETIAMKYGATFSGGGLDPLFSALFHAATFLNFFSAFAIARPLSLWIGISVIAHLSFNYRIVRGGQMAAAQRALDLERFRGLQQSPQ